MWIVRHKEKPELFWHTGVGWFKKDHYAHGPSRIPDHLKANLPLPANGEWVMDTILSTVAPVVPVA